MLVYQTGHRKKAPLCAQAGNPLISCKSFSLSYKRFNNCDSAKSDFLVGLRFKLAPYFAD